MTGRGLLLHELDWIVANCCRFFDRIEPEHHGWRPQEGVRTLCELTNHLAQIPQVDLRIIQGKTENEIDDMENSLWREHPKAWGGVMREGAGDMRRFMEQLSLDDYENGSATAYFGRTQTHCQWLLEAVTHCFHHRAQLFMYLKLNGLNVGTRDLYS